MTRRDAVVLALAVAIGLAGCTAAEPTRTYTPTAANELQSVVLDISVAASAEDYAAAAGSLDELEAVAVSAFSLGEISSARYDAIMVAIRLVRADLEAAMAQEAEGTRDPTPAPEPVEADPGTGSGTTGGTGGTSGSGGTSSGGTTGDTGGTGNGNGRGNPGEPGPPDDRGKPDG